MNHIDLERLVRGEVTEDEKREIINWIRKDVSHQKEYNRIKAQYVASQIRHKESNINLDRKYQEFQKKKASSKSIFYATSGLAVILIFSFFFINKESLYKMISNHGTDNPGLVKVSTMAGDSKQVVLSDGSVVTLNAESSLIYNKSFKGNMRTVKLTGEAFFEIKKDSGKPFIVETDKLKIKVLGTTFNVKSYPDDVKIETTLATGSVEVMQDNIEPIVLQPAQKAIFHKRDNSVNVETAEPEIVSAWKYGKLIFHKTALKDVILDIERKYDVNIKVGSNNLLQYEFTGTFDNLTLKEALQLLETSSDIKYELKNNEVMLENK